MYNKLEKFIEKARKTHGDKYDYSKVEYKDSLTKVCIICPEHGEFWQTPAAHVRGNECPQCANYKRGRVARWDKNQFILKAQEIHGDKYDYSKVKYINANEKVCIICPEHGEFWQMPSAHLQGQGCSKCAGRNLTREELIKKFNSIHNNKYDYSKVDFSKIHNKVCIICSEHGEFWQTPAKHLQGQGCPKCSKRQRGLNSRISKEEFIKRVTEIHGDKYIFSEVNYTTMHEKIEVICKKHGSFYIRPYDLLNGHGCPKCAGLESKAETEIYEYICELIGKDNVVRRNRLILGNGQELDIFIPSMNIAIEYNGLRWHSEYTGKDRQYHLNKTEICQSRGIKLIQIFEDEYLENKSLVLKKISHLLNVGTKQTKVMGRKCCIYEIPKEKAKQFLDNNHIQKYGKSTVTLGAFYEQILIGVMTFVKTDKDGVWELNRFASDNNIICQGVGGKLFKYFISKYNPEAVKSFADRRWTLNENDNLYTKLGFKLTGTLPPDYRYINKDNPDKRIHKFNLRKKELHRKYNLDMSLTESQMVEQLGLVKIWDCGLYKYEWKKDE